MAKKKTTAVVFEDYDKFKEGPPGSIMFMGGNNVPEGTVTSMAIKCPGCGEISALTIEYEGCKARGAKWDLKSREPATLHPSIHHAKDLEGCGWHGWLKNGEFVA